MKLTETQIPINCYGTTIFNVDNFSNSTSPLCATKAKFITNGISYKHSTFIKLVILLTHTTYL